MQRSHAQRQRHQDDNTFESTHAAQEAPARINDTFDAAHMRQQHQHRRRKSGTGKGKMKQGMNNSDETTTQADTMMEQQQQRASKKDPDRTVMAMIENNSWEIGIACINTKLVKLRVWQITDSRRYALTRSLIETEHPDEILIPDTHRSRLLAQMLQSDINLKKSSTTLVPIVRSNFNETEGASKVEEYATKNALPLLAANLNHLARSSICAVARFVQAEYHIVLRKESLPVVLETPQNRMRMDATTIRDLELIANRRSGSSEGSLFRLLARTKTPMGARLLRSQLISPPCDEETIRLRSEMVEELVKRADVREGVAIHLEKLHDIDHLTSHFAFNAMAESISNPSFNPSLMMLKREIDDAVRLREVLLLVPSIRNGLDPLSSQLARMLKKVLQLGTGNDGASEGEKECIPPLKLALEAIDAKLDPEATFTSNSARQRIEEIFCIRTDDAGMLDVARAAFACTISDMENLVVKYSQEHTIDVKLSFTRNRGYHMRLPRAAEASIPKCFIQAVRQKAHIYCTTPELASLNNRQDLATHEIFRLSALQLNALRSAITPALYAMHRLSEAISLLDLVASFASLASNGVGQYVMPRVRKWNGTSQEKLSIIKGRHPILESEMKQFEFSSLGGSGGGRDSPTFVPNDVVFANQQRVAVVTGPNCSGKSTVLKQTALIVIMAHIGSFVPAHSAEIPLTSRVCTRIGTDDSIERNASSFSLEMQETAWILDSIEFDQSNDPALVIIDELGRGTSVRDGLAIAWSVMEHLLLKEKVICLFATHFHEMIQLVQIAGNELGKSLTFMNSMEATGKDHEDDSHRLQEESKSDQGKNSNYGISLASQMGLDPAIIRDAETYLKVLDDQTRSIGEPGAHAQMEQAKLIKIQQEFAERVRECKAKAEVDDASLTEIRRSLVAIQEHLRNMMTSC